MRVRRAVVEDVMAITEGFAGVVEEGVLGTEPPVDIDARGARFRRQIAQEEPVAVWVLEDGSEILGHAGVMETDARGVLSMFVAIVAEGPRSPGRIAALVAAHGAQRRAVRARLIRLYQSLPSD